MVMDVRNIVGGQSRAALRKSERSRKKSAIASTPGSGEADSSDSVSLTGQAGQIGALIAQMKAAPAVDTHRVEPVKEKVEKGEYDIDYERVANKMLDFESDYYGY